MSAPTPAVDPPAADRPGTAGPRRRARIGDHLMAVVAALAGPHDVIDVLHRIVQGAGRALDVGEAGIALVEGSGLRLVASSSDRMRFVEAVEVAFDEGPCPDAAATGAVVRADDLHRARGRWPRFAPVALSAGMASAYAVPLVGQGRTLGALNLFSDRAGALRPEDEVVARAIADVATLAVVLGPHTGVDVIDERVRATLGRQARWEEATALLTDRLGVDVDDALAALRAHAPAAAAARSSIAEDVIEGRVDPRALLRPA